MNLDLRGVYCLKENLRRLKISLKNVNSSHSFLFVLLEAGVSAVNIAPALKNNHFMGIKILDQKQLSFKNIQGIKFFHLETIPKKSDCAIHKIPDCFGRILKRIFHRLFLVLTF